MGTGTAGTVQTVTSTMAFRRWASFLACERSRFVFVQASSCLKTFSLVDALCVQNGDYNKPIPAQYLEHLNHGVSAGPPTSETPKTHQWVNCQMLLCRKCNNNQSLKIKKLASFLPRNEVGTAAALEPNALFSLSILVRPRNVSNLCFAGELR